MISKFFKTNGFLIFKSVVLTVLPVCAGYLIDLSMQSGQLKAEQYKGAAIFLLATHVVAIILFAIKDHNFKIKYRNIKAVNEAINKTNSILANLSSTLYESVKSYRHNKHTEIENWAMINANCDDICSGMHTLVNKIAEKGDKFSVSIIFKVQKNGEDGFYMASRSAYNLNNPAMYRTFVSNNEAGKRHYKKLLNDENAQIEILANKDEVKNAFAGYDKKYNQYVAIPICCPGNKKIALLQIVAYDDCVIASDKEDLREITNQYFLFFSNLGLLANKIENIIQCI